MSAKACRCGAKGDVVETRSREDGALRRRRCCISCGAGWTTIEVRVERGFTVVPLPLAAAKGLADKARELTAKLATMFELLGVTRLASEMSDSPAPNEEQP